MQHLKIETVIDYLHGELAPDQDASVLAHLEGCAECKRELELEAALTERLRSAARAEEIELPLGFASAVKARIAADEGNPFGRFVRRLRPIVLVPVLGVAAMAAALIVVPLARHAPVPGQAFPVAYLLEEHAAHAQENPLTDRSESQMITAGFDRTGSSGEIVAAPLMQVDQSSSLSNDGNR